MAPCVFQYVDYRSFVRDLIAYKRHDNASYSLEGIARRSGCMSKSLLSLVVTGRRNLTNGRVVGLAETLGLKGAELNYFVSLVDFNQAKDASAREQALATMTRLARRRSEANLPVNTYRILENWHCLVIRDLARLPDFDPEPAAISKRLKGRVSTSQARKAIQALSSTGLLKPDKDGLLQPSDETLRTTDEVSSVAIRKYHKSCLTLAENIIEDEPVEKREFASMNIVLKKSDKDKLKELIKDFREQVLALSASNVGEPATITQLNLQMFDLSE